MESASDGSGGAAGEGCPILDEGTVGQGVGPYEDEGMGPDTEGHDIAIGTAEGSAEEGFDVRDGFSKPDEVTDQRERRWSRRELVYGR